MKRDKKYPVNIDPNYHNIYEIVYRYSDSGLMHDKLQNYIDIMMEKTASI